MRIVHIVNIPGVLVKVLAEHQDEDIYSIIDASSFSYMKACVFALAPCCKLRAWEGIVGNVKGKERGARKEGYSPGPGEGVWPGQEKWHTRR